MFDSSVTKAIGHQYMYRSLYTIDWESSIQQCNGDCMADLILDSAYLKILQDIE